MEVEQNTVRKSLRATLREMTPGQIMWFPVAKYKTVKVTCSDLKLYNSGLEYSTKLNRAEGKFSVERIS